MSLPLPGSDVSRKLVTPTQDAGVKVSAKEETFRSEYPTWDEGEDPLVEGASQRTHGEPQSTED